MDVYTTCCIFDNDCEPLTWVGSSLDDVRAFPNFFSQAIRGDDVTLYGDGSQTRSICYVDDLVEGIWRLLHSDHVGPMNIGSENEVSMRELAETILRLTGSKSRLVERKGVVPVFISAKQPVP